MTDKDAPLFEVVGELSYDQDEAEEHVCDDICVSELDSSFEECGNCGIYHHPDEPCDSPSYVSEDDYYGRV